MSALSIYHRKVNGKQIVSFRAPFGLSEKERFELYFEMASELECWPWFGARLNNGYGTFTFDGVQQNAHRISYMLYIGIIPEGQCVLHRCDNRPCVNPAHLFLGTRHDNILDASRKMRLRIGVSHHASKLTADIVRQARLAHGQGVGIGPLSRQFGVDWKTMSSAVLCKTWRHVR